MKHLLKIVGIPLIIGLLVTIITLWVNREELTEYPQELKSEFVDGDNDTYTPNAGDCDDNNISIHPDADELDGDGIDSNCDGKDNFAGLRKLKLMEDKLTPELPIDPPATNVVRKLGGKILHLPSPLNRAKLELVIGFDEKYFPDSVPSYLGVGIYIEADIPSATAQCKNCWEYFRKIGTSYTRITNVNCSGQLKETDFTMSKREGRIVQLPTINLSKVPLSAPSVIDIKDWPCDSMKNVDLQSLLNEASRNNQDVKLGFYTTKPGIGRIVSAVLVYEGREIQVIEP